MARARKVYKIVKQKNEPEIVMHDETVLVVRNGKRYTGIDAKLAEDLRRQVEDLTSDERAELRAHFSKRADTGTPGRAIVVERADGSETLVGDGKVSRLEMTPREPGAVEKRHTDRDYLDDAIGDVKGSGASVERLN